MAATAAARTCKRRPSLGTSDIQEEYLAVFPQATLAKTGKDMGTCEAWGYALEQAAPVPCDNLQSIVGVLTAFLVSETSCERNFSAEHRQFMGRPRLSPEMRFAGLKCMVDGVALDKLQQDGRLTC